MRTTLAIICLIACFGCGDTNKSQVSDPQVPKYTVLGLLGSSGIVNIGGTLDEAKKAFPPAEKAEVFDKSMSFAILRKDGWAWGGGSGSGFEVALDKGKIVAMVLTNLDGPPLADALDLEVRHLGEPTNKAESDNAALYVWVSGESARFFMLLKNDKFMMGPGTMTIIGPKEALKMLNYQYDEPEIFVKMIDNAVDAMKPAL